MRDSRRYHRAHRGPRHERFFNFGNSSSTPTIVSPFGRMPQGLAHQLQGSVYGPWANLLGFGPGGNSPSAQKFAGLEQQLQSGQATGPLAGILSFLQGFEPGVPSQAQQIGSDAAARGSAAFTGLQGQIDNFLQQLPGFQDYVTQGANLTNQGAGLVNQAGGLVNQGAGLLGQAGSEIQQSFPALQQAAQTAGQGANYAQQFAQQAFDPTSQSPLYGAAATRLLNVLRPGEAARGMLTGGAGQQSEQDALQNLSFQFAQNQQGNQSQAIQNLLGAGQGLTGAGLGIAQGGQALGGIGSAYGGLGGTLGGLGGTLGQLGQGLGQLGQVGAGIAGLGPEMQAQLFPAIQNLMQLQQAGYQLPIQGIGELLSLLQPGAQGLSSLLGQTSPTVANQSSQFQFGLL